jgi:hypothetical protein
MTDEIFDDGLSDPLAYVRSLVKGLGYDDDPKSQQLQTHLARRAASDRKMATRINALFKTAAGQDVLEWLIDNTKRRDVLSVEMMMGYRQDQLAMFAAWRGGENSVVDMILDAMAHAQTRRRKKRNPV